MVYLIVLTLLVYLTYKYDYLKKEKNKWRWYYFIMTILICISGFRYRLGIDSIRYENYFYSYQDTLASFDFSGLNLLRYEPLYELFGIICKTIVPEFWFMQLMQALLVNSIVFYFFKRFTSNVFMAITIYTLSQFLGYTMETMRAGCAISMMLLGYVQFKKGRDFLSIFYFILSFLFHYESIILIPLYIYLKLYDNRISMGKWYWFSIMLTIVLSPIVVMFFGRYIEFLSLTSRMSGSIDSYGDGGFFETKLNVVGMLSSFIVIVLVPLLSIYSLKRIYCKYTHEAIILWSIFILVFSLDIFVFYRYKEYFAPFIILLLADAFDLKKMYVSRNHIIKLQSFVVKCVIILFPFFYSSVLGKLKTDPEARVEYYWEYYPYTSIFNPQTYKEREAMYNRYIGGY